MGCPDPQRPAPRPERPRRGFFGMLNWGDWNYPGYHDTTKGCDAWGNLEYDMTQVLALAYAATGEPDYYEGMIAAARHFMDVDTIHYQRQRPAWVGMNHPKNPLHFAFELGGVDLGHTWTEGLLSYYYLTGDERGLEMARGIADYLVRRLHAGVVAGNPRQWGWPQIALVAVYDATNNQTYRDAALEFARNGMALHGPDNVADFKMGVLADALSYTQALTRDASIAQWLVRHAAAVRARGAAVDARLSPAVAYVGHMKPDERARDAAAGSVSRLKFGNWGKPFTIAGRVGFRVLSLTQQSPPLAKGD
jgi:beta-L-arabinofuranosidase (glycosyl hydrolase family 127)